MWCCLATLGEMEDHFFHRAGGWGVNQKKRGRGKLFLFYIARVFLSSLSLTKEGRHHSRGGAGDALNKWGGVVF